jgi:septum formation protein
MNPIIYLASGSPRRRELLEQMGVPFERLAVEVPEVPQMGESPEDYAVRVALDKARAGREHLSAGAPLPVLGADTAVVAGDRILGKPSGREDALAMLEMLSGSTHRVLTAVALAGPDGGEAIRLSESRVSFRATTAAERSAYWQTGEPVGKAGGYAIQGRGAVFIERLEGSYSGVMGLPIYETAELLGIFGYEVPAGWAGSE